MSGRSLLSIIVLVLALANPALAERRVALVIGNDVYRNLSDNEQLHNAVNDARAVKATLEGLGFEVIAGENLNRASLVERLPDFGARLQQGDIAFFFYAGHGVSLNGANYILPSDISAPRSTGRDEEEQLAVFLIVDNLRGHHAKAVQEWLAQHKDTIKIFYLPAYAPEHNPDEYLNNDLKQTIKNKPRAKTRDDLVATTSSILKSIQRSPNRVKSYFHAKHVRYAA